MLFLSCISTSLWYLLKPLSNMSQEKFYSGVLKKKKYKLKFNLDNLIFSEFKKHEFYFKLF